MLKENNSSIAFFLTRSLFLGFGVALMFQNANKDAYIGAILGTILGFGIILIYSYLLSKKQEFTLKELCLKNKIIGTLTRALFLLTSFLILIYTVIIFKIFIVSFMLVNTPELLITIPFLIISAYAAFKGLKVIGRVARSLFPLSIVSIIFTVFSLAGYIQFEHFFPILDVGTLNIFKSTIIFTSISVFPNILLFHLKTPKRIALNYLIGAISIIFVLFIVNGIFGSELITIFRFSEYMVLKQLKLLNFIEKVENILSIVWLFDLFITSMMAIYSIKEMLPNKHNKITTSLVLLIVLILIDKVFAFNYVNELISYYYLPIIGLALSILIIINMFYLIKKQ